jgi:branched-chain amino acid transport system permease protein
MLLAPTAFRSSGLMTPPLVQGMAAAVVGGFASLPGAVLGGLVIGLSENLLAYWVSPGWKTPFAFLVLFLVLIVRPTGLIPERVAVRV